MGGKADEELPEDFAGAGAFDDCVEAKGVGAFDGIGGNAEAELPLAALAMPVV